MLEIEVIAKGLLTVRLDPHFGTSGSLGPDDLPLGMLTLFRTDW
jgi:hypothetical protein